MSSESPTPDKPSNDHELSDYRQSSDIVITVDTGNSVCSTILVEGCSDDLDLSLNDDADSPSSPKMTRSKTSELAALSAKQASPRKTRKGRKTRSQSRKSAPGSSKSARKGMSYLRSAVLSRDEINREVLHHSKADIPKPREASLFTTKLMMRLASRLPPSRARPTCEELKEMMNAHRDGEVDYQSLRHTGQGTPLRVKAEKPSFCETINHIMQPPSLDEPGDYSPDMFLDVTCSNIHCREEREHKIAILQQEEVHEEVETKSAIPNLTIETLQQAMRNTSQANRKEIEKQIALNQLETLRGKRGRPPK